MRNIRIDLCYDGTRFRGWQRQSGTDDTVQGKLETALSRILGEDITVSGSGRTDTGAHAKMQVANFHCESAMPCSQILSELRRYLPQDIGIYSCKEASERFHARLNAKSKTYCYRLWNSDTPCVFDRRYVCVDARSVDIEKMRAAAQYLLGTHDFSAFCTKPNKSTVRCITQFDIDNRDNEIVFTVSGNGFLYNMVRILVGTLLEVGRGEREPDSIPLLFGGKRSDAGEKVPACGLCLMEVSY